MNVIKKRVKSKGNILSFDLPEFFRDKELEVIVKVKEDIVEEELLLNDVHIDTNKWKFNREEIYNE